MTAFRAGIIEAFVAMIERQLDELEVELVFRTLAAGPRHRDPLAEAMLHALRGDGAAAVDERLVARALVNELVDRLQGPA